MDIEATKETAKVSYCKEYDYFIAKSDLCLQVIGTGYTEEDALQTFYYFLQEAYRGYLLGIFKPDTI